MKFRPSMDYENGQLFIWNNDMYRVVKQVDTSETPVQVKRVASYNRMQEAWVYVENTHVENFNPLTPVANIGVFEHA